MEKYIRTVTVIIVTIITMLCGTVTAGAIGLYEEEINIHCTNAPEGTAFADILFPKVEGDEYAPDKDSTDYQKQDVCRIVSVEDKDMELDDSCGLALYDDGFTSCMMRRYFVCSNRVNPDRYTLDWNQPSEARNHSIFDYYGQFKVAYCDKDGNVLLVTDPVTVKPHKNCVYEIYTDGIKAEYKVIKNGAVWLTTFIIIAVMAIPVVVISALFIIIMKIAGKKKKRSEG